MAPDQMKDAVAQLGGKLLEAVDEAINDARPDTHGPESPRSVISAERWSGRLPPADIMQEGAGQKQVAIDVREARCECEGNLGTPTCAQRPPA